MLGELLVLKPALDEEFVLTLDNELEELPEATLLPVV
tara:strand:+ start:365 stop:475 length:111 start_codon:yes stop_codon:yes gene_type:complete